MQEKKLEVTKVVSFVRISQSYQISLNVARNYKQKGGLTFMAKFRSKCDYIDLSMCSWCKMLENDACNCVQQ